MPLFPLTVFSELSGSFLGTKLPSATTNTSTAKLSAPFIKLPNQLCQIAMSFLDEIRCTKPLKAIGKHLIRDRSAAVVMKSNDTFDTLKQQDQFLDTFLQSSCTSWLEHIKDLTFSSSICTLNRGEAEVIVSHWNARQRLCHLEAGSKISAMKEDLLNSKIAELQPLLDRMHELVVQEKARSPVRKVFMKLTTRSPKDSERVLQQASKAYMERLAECQATWELEGIKEMDNEKWKLLCEEVLNASAVSNARDGLELLLDSERVFEDLDCILKGDDSINLDNRIGVVVRSWNPRVKPENEFRGICQNGVLTCLCQYYHPIYFSNLQSKANLIQKDIINCFHHPSVANAVKSVGSNCIIDFAWLGTNEVIIIELNPFDGVCLGVFPASTGLFLWDDPGDKSIMKGEAPFEFRLREKPLSKPLLLSQCSKSWVDIIYPKSPEANQST